MRTHKNYQENIIPFISTEYIKLTESITDTFFGLDKDLRFTFWNQASEQLTNLPAQEVLGKPLHGVFPLIEGTPIEETFLKVLDSGKPERITNKLELNGSDRSFEFSVYPVDGGISVLARDISEIQSHTEEIQRAEERYRSTLNSMLEGCAIISRDWKYLYANEVHKKQAYITESDLTGKLLFDLVPGFKRSSFHKAFLVTMEQRIPNHIEDCFTFEAGHTCWYRVRSIPVPEGIFILSMDITEQKKYEEELLRYQSILTQTEKMAHLGSWWIELTEIENINNNKLNWSEEVYMIFGYEPFSIDVSNDLFFSHVHPDDRQKITSGISSAISDKRPYNIEHRIICKNGEEKIVHEYANVIFDKEGSPVRIVGAVHDITDHKRKEERILQLLRVSELRGAELNAIIESMPDAVYIGSREGMTLCNTNALKMLGAESITDLKERIGELGDKFNIRWPDSGIPLSENELQFTRALNGETVAEEVMATNVTTGEDIFIRSACAPIKQNGSIIGAVAVNSDITERKKAELVIKDSLKEKEVLLRELYHRTKNNMQVISSIIGLKAASVDDPGTAEILEEMKNRILSIALVHQKLYQSNNLSKVDLKEYITDLVRLLDSSYAVHSQSIKINLQLEENIYVLIDTAIPCGLIINELVSNSLKYGYPANRSGEIFICLKRLENDIIELVVADDGIGMTKKDLEGNQKLGLQLVRVIAEDQLQAETEVIISAGVKWQIRFRDILYQERV